MVKEVIQFCGGGYIPCGGSFTTLVILVSALGPNFGLRFRLGPGLDNSVSPRSKSFFFLFWGTTFPLEGLLGQGLGLGLGPGLDNNDS